MDAGKWTLRCGIDVRAIVIESQGLACEDEEPAYLSVGFKIGTGNPDGGC
jgi:5-carboxymethyl-2-hydroxymuconate isomerase